MNKHPLAPSERGGTEHRGFTLIELIVIISIFAIMASVALFNFNGFKSNVSLNNLSHDIALTIRQAQVSGWNTITTSFDANGNPLRLPQGVYFGMTTPGIFDDQMILYGKLNPPADESAGSYYDLPNNDVIADTVKIQGPNHISRILYSSDLTSLSLGTNHQIPAVSTGGIIAAAADSVSIAFSRPLPEALLFEGSAPVPAATQYLGIYITADTDCPVTTSTCSTASYVITVSRSGEIEVQ